MGKVQPDEYLLTVMLLKAEIIFQRKKVAALVIIAMKNKGKHQVGI